ncbi:hypothetical protein ACP4OV_007793 [Aristida adscensionis]
MAGGFSSSSSGSGSHGRDDSELPLVLCPYCEAMVVERISWTPENYGRKFYWCLTVKAGVQCKFFKWQGPYAVWLLSSGYLRVPGEDQLEPNAVLAEMAAAIRSLDDDMKVMNTEMKSSMRAIRVGLASNAVMVKRNSETLDRRLSVASVFVLVVLLFVAIMLVKK